MNWVETDTLGQNAQRLNLTYDQVYQMARKNKLKYAHAKDLPRQPIVRWKEDVPAPGWLLKFNHFGYAWDEVSVLI